MKQISLDLKLSVKKTRKRELMGQVVPWGMLVELIAPYYPEVRNCRPLFRLDAMLRTHFMQQWFTLSGPGMEEAFFDVPLCRECAQLADYGCLPDERTILCFRHRLEGGRLADQILATVNGLLSQCGLLHKVGAAVDAALALIAAPSSTKNADKARGPERHSAKKGNQWHFGVKAHISVDADPGLVHAVRGTAAHVSDVTEGHSLLHDGQETVVFAGAGYQGLAKRPDGMPGALWHVAMRPGKRKALDKSKEADAMIEKAEKLMASVRAKVEHPFRVIKRQFGYVKVRYRGLKKNTQQLVALFALSNLWMVRSRLLAMGPQG